MIPAELKQIISSSTPIEIVKHARNAITKKIGGECRVTDGEVIKFLRTGDADKGYEKIWRLAYERLYGKKPEAPKQKQKIITPSKGVTVKQLISLIGKTYNQLSAAWLTNQGCYFPETSLWAMSLSAKIGPGEAYRITSDLLYALKYADPKGVISVGDTHIRVNGVPLWNFASCQKLEFENLKDIEAPPVEIPDAMLGKIITALNFASHDGTRPVLSLAHLQDGKYYTADGSILYAFSSQGIDLPYLPLHDIKLLRTIDTKLTGLTVRVHTLTNGKNHPDVTFESSLPNGVTVRSQMTVHHIDIAWTAKKHRGEFNELSEPGLPRFRISFLPGFDAVAKIKGAEIGSDIKGAQYMWQGKELLPPVPDYIFRAIFPDQRTPLRLNASFMAKAIRAIDNRDFEGIVSRDGVNNLCSSFWSENDDGDMVLIMGIRTGRETP